MQRVLILGCCGSGKSTLSRRLAAITGLPRIELDHAFWRSGWQPTPREEWRSTVAAVCEQPAWIIDGNYTNTLTMRLVRADTVIWLDYPRQLCVRRVLGASPGTTAGCATEWRRAARSVLIWNSCAIYGISTGRAGRGSWQLWKAMGLTHASTACKPTRTPKDCSRS